jgi:hypothetical protein
MRCIKAPASRWFSMEILCHTLADWTHAPARFGLLCCAGLREQVCDEIVEIFAHEHLLEVGWHQ